MWCLVFYLLSAIPFLCGAEYWQIPSCKGKECKTSKEEARKYIKESDETIRELQKIWMDAWYTNYIDNNVDNAKKQSDAATEYYKFAEEVLKKFEQFDWEAINDPKLTEIASLFLAIEGGPADLLAEAYNHLSPVEEGILNAKVCKWNHVDCNQTLQMHEIDEIMKTSRDPEELSYYWDNWKKEATCGSKENYLKYMYTYRKIANKMGFKDAEARKNYVFFDSEITDRLMRLWSQKYKINGKDISVEDIYKEIHTFAKSRLIEEYGEKVEIDKDGPIPAHLLGSLNLKNWLGIKELLVPFPDVESLNYTKLLKSKNITVPTMMKLVEEFYRNLGFRDLPQSFWDKSVFERPLHGNVKCNPPYAFSFYKDREYRIVMCATPTKTGLILAFHELGHIYYYDQYNDKPYILQESQDPGFHEAIGYLLGDTAATQAYLRRVGILDDNFPISDKTVTIDDGQTFVMSDINQIMETALMYITEYAFQLPYNEWKRSVRLGTADTSSLNQDYWDKVKKIQGVSRPLQLDEDEIDHAFQQHGTDYDTKWYIAGAIQQFMALESLCKKAGKYQGYNKNGPFLSECDFSSGGQDIGKKIINAMKIGRSQSPNVLEDLTGYKEYTAGPMVAYFYPLHQVLKYLNLNSKTGASHWK